MASNPAQSRYIADSVSTATPAKLVVMLYDRLGLDLGRAAEALGGNQVTEAATQDARLEAAPHLLHAQQILAELLASLKLDAWDGASDLAGLYSYLIRELVTVNLHSDAALLGRCIEIITGLRVAWRDAAAQLSNGGQGRGAAAGAWVA